MIKLKSGKSQSCSFSQYILTQNLLIQNTVVDAKIIKVKITEVLPPVIPHSNIGARHASIDLEKNGLPST